MNISSKIINYAQNTGHYLLNKGNCLLNNAKYYGRNVYQITHNSLQNKPVAVIATVAIAALSYKISDRIERSLINKGFYDKVGEKIGNGGGVAFCCLLNTATFAIVNLAAYKFLLPALSPQASAMISVATAVSIYIYHNA